MRKVLPTAVAEPRTGSAFAYDRNLFRLETRIHKLATVPFGKIEVQSG